MKPATATLVRAAWRFGFGVWLAAGGALRPAAAEFTAGAAAAEITPDPAMPNWTVPRPYGEVHDPLRVRAVVLADGDSKVALIGWDLLDAREFAVARVRREVAAATGIAPERIMVQATHNHAGPKSEMGPEPLMPRERGLSAAAQRHPTYRPWADRLVGLTVETVRRADAARVPATLRLGRATVGEWMFNRRPLRPDGTVQSMLEPADPTVLPNGLRFGPVDPTLTVIGLRGTDGAAVATLFHVPIHAVVVYGGYKGLSADWPGAATDALADKVGGAAMFLQGCAGDIVPSRRGLEVAAKMGAAVAERAAAAAAKAVPLRHGRLRVASETLSLPVNAEVKAVMQTETLAAEISAVRCGELALVFLPGEPLQEIGTAIQAASPFFHTVVLGYANGRGVGYFGLPGGKKQGGYEMTDVGAGNDEAGRLIVEAAGRVLRRLAAEPP